MADHNPIMLFPNERSINVSHEFIVPNDMLGLIQIKDLPDCGYIVIEYHFGVDCDFTWEPFNFCGKQQEICYPSTNYILPIPGRYRLVLLSDEGEHIEDPTFFEDTQIQYRVIRSSHDISAYYTPCCNCCGESGI